VGYRYSFEVLRGFQTDLNIAYDLRRETYKPQPILNWTTG